MEIIKKPFWMDDLFDVLYYSENLKYFFEKYQIVDHSSFPMAYVKDLYKSNKFLAIDIIHELSLRGFEFITNFSNSLIPDVNISKDCDVIRVDKKTKNHIYKNYKKINFEKYGYGNLTQRFKIENDHFFNNIPLEGFKYINNNGKLALLLEDIISQKNYSIVHNSENIQKISPVIIKNIKLKIKKVIKEKIIETAESKFIKNNQLETLQNISTAKYFKKGITTNKFINLLESQYDIVKMKDLINYKMIDDVLNNLDNILTDRKWNIINWIQQYHRRISYKGDFILLSEIYKNPEFKLFIDECHKEDIFDLRDLSSMKLGELLKKHNHIKKQVLSIFYKSYEKYNLNVLDFNKASIPFYDIFYKRILNNTSFSDLGKECGFSKQRMSQLEQQFLKKFSYYFLVVEDYLINIISEGKESINIVFGSEKLKEIYKNDKHIDIIFTHFIQKGLTEKIKYFDDINKFIINGDIEKTKSNLKKLVKESFDEDIIDINEENFEELLWAYDLSYLVADDLGIFLQNNNWTRYGNCFLKGLFTRDKILKVVMPYFKDGILLDKDGLEEIRQQILKKFGVKVLDISDRSLNAFVGEHFVLCDRNKFIDYKNIQIDKVLLKQIQDYVDRVHAISVSVGMEELYEKFKKKLKKESNIINHFMLYGVFKYNFPDEYYYKKAIRRKESKGKRMTKIFEEYILNHKWIKVHQSQIKHDLNMKTFMISNYVSWNKNIFSWDDYKYFIHIDNVLSDIPDIKSFTDKLRELIGISMIKNQKFLPELDDYTNSNLVFNLDKEYFISRSIPNHFSLFSIMNYLLNEEYGFYRPHISKDKKNKKKHTFKYIIKCFANRDVKYFTYADFEKFSEKLIGRQYSSKNNIINLFNDIRDQIYKIEDDKYCSKNKFRSK